MAFRTFSGFIICMIFSTAIWAEELQINPSHPQQYTVVTGDTLWDIAGKFLNHPWQWPALWKNNEQIVNPNLIYPGDTIYFSVVNGRPQLSLTRTEPSNSPTGNGTCIIKQEDVKQGRTEFRTDEYGKVMPCIREIPVKQAINLIPSDAIAKFLNNPRVVSAQEFTKSPYVVGFAGEHLIAGNGDKIYVRAIDSPENLTYIVYQMGETYISPETGEILGYEARYIANANLLQSGDPATLSVAKSASEIKVGDRLMLSEEEDIALNYFPEPPEKQITGSIISILGGVSQIGLYNVVVIDKGIKDGLKTGHELAIYKRGKIAADPYSQNKNATVRLPDDLAGTLMVFRPFERISYALVVKAKQAIHILDKVETP